MLPKKNLVVSEISSLLFAAILLLSNTTIASGFSQIERSSVHDSSSKRLIIDYIIEKFLESLVQISCIFRTRLEVGDVVICRKFVSIILIDLNVVDHINLVSQ